MPDLKRINFSSKGVSDFSKKNLQALLQGKNIVLNKSMETVKAMPEDQSRAADTNVSASTSTDEADKESNESVNLDASLSSALNDSTATASSDFLNDSGFSTMDNSMSSDM